MAKGVKKLKVARERLDEALVRRGFCENKDEAARLIMAASVLVNDQPSTKAGTTIPMDANLRLRRKSGNFVSRAGDKLEGALNAFGVAVQGRICLDLGASTGGFTDCLLRRGAAKVYAVDVGTNQLVYQLRTHPDVVCLERTHANKLNPQLVPEAIELVVVDVSFTSLRYVLPYVLPLLAPEAEAICLFKPQFEVARHLVKPGGLVAESDAQAALDAFKHWLADQSMALAGCMKSTVKGKDGNQEYLLKLNIP